MTPPDMRRLKWLVCALLGAAALAVFSPALHCGFVLFDDSEYIVKNTEIQRGLDGRAVQWALTTARASNWHPLTWLSHALDCQFYGLRPAGHHLTSLLWHAASSVLLFLLLNRLTGALWRSAFVAAMFALHPLRVESVVWIAERKDVLSTFFWMLAVWAYVRYMENLKSQISNLKFWYALALVFYALGLMSKAMLVTLPFVLLLLDYWPLGRLEFGPDFSRRLLVEKIPFFLLAAADSAVTYLIQNQQGVVKALNAFPLSERLANVPVAYALYLGKNFWPSGLTALYPRHPLGPLEIGGAVCLLGAVSLLVARHGRARPWLPVGWLWFLGMLVPTLGLVKVGDQSMADRYSYLPSVGLWIMVAWEAGAWVRGHPRARRVAALGGAAAVVACLTLTPRQIGFWRDSHTLSMRAAAVFSAAEKTDPVSLDCYNQGCDAVARRDYPRAVLHFQEALRSEAEHHLWECQARACNNLGYAYLHEGQISNAVASFEKALAIRPFYPEALFNVGCAFMTNNQPDVAVDCFHSALDMDPAAVEIHCNLAGALAQLGRLAEAVAAAQQARQLALAQNNPALARILESQIQKYQRGEGGFRP
jgi:Flp pilus assembly protein TadD